MMFKLADIGVAMGIAGTKVREREREWRRVISSSSRTAVEGLVLRGMGRRRSMSDRLDGVQVGGDWSDQGHNRDRGERGRDSRRVISCGNRTAV